MYVEIQSDAWALDRLHKSRRRGEVIGLGFSHLGYVFSRVASLNWDRAALGLTTECLVDAEKTTTCELDLLFDVEVVAFKSLLEDGTVIKTSCVPKTLSTADSYSWLRASRPGSGWHAHSVEDWDGPSLLSQHHARLKQIASERASSPVLHRDLTSVFAIAERGLDVMRSINLVPMGSGRDLGYWALVAGTVATVVVGLLMFESAVVAVLLAAVWTAVAGVVRYRVWKGRFGKAVPLPLVSAAELMSRPAVTKRLGDNQVSPVP